MRCRECDYRLWNLRERRCPECGTPFVPSAFEFAPNSVQFCCPHCAQAYYGTAPNGHLVPAEFSCVQCGNAVRMDDMVLLPAAGLEEEQTNPYRVPWLEWRKRGLFSACFATIWAALVTPGKLMRGLPGDASIGAAREFASLMLLAVALGGTLPATGMLLIAALGAGAGRGALIGIPFIIAGAFLGLSLVVVLWGLAAHGLLCLGGPTQGLRRTHQAICYSTGANTISAIPCFGPYVGWIWWLVSATVMLKEAHRVSGWRAAFAVITPPLVVGGGAIALYIWFMLTVFARLSATTAMMPVAAPTNVEARPVLNAVLKYADDHGGVGPKHAAELIASGDLMALQLVSRSSMGNMSSMPVGGTTLDRFANLSDAEAINQAQAAAAALPPDVVAHRLGDYVFVYHGLDFGAPDPNLWVVVGLPDPNAPRSTQLSVTFGNQVSTTQPLQGLPPTFTVGCADGRVRQYPTSELAEKLAEQNEVRAEHGLEALPDPGSVTHTQPAVRSRE